MLPSDRVVRLMTIASFAELEILLPFMSKNSVVEADEALVMATDTGSPVLVTVTISLSARVSPSI